MGTRPEITYRRALRAWHDHFHDAAGFCERQRRVGRATGVLFAKHPGIAVEFGAREVAKARAVALRLKPEEALTGTELAEAEGLLGAGLESVGDSRVRWRDRVWLGLFWYHQAKGMVEAQGGGSADAVVLSALMGRAVACALRAALADAGCSRDSDTRTRLGHLAVRLGPFSPEGGRCLRWWLSVRGRETYHWLRSRA
jgi:hypothetical protein